MKSKIFPSDKCKEYKKYQSNYEENILNDLKEHKYPLPMYKVENIAETDNAIVFTLHRMKGITDCPLFASIAASKKDLKSLIKSIMAEDYDSDIYCYNKLFDESYDKIVTILQYSSLLANTTTAKFDDIEYILYSVDIDSEGYIGTSLVVDIDYMKHDSYFMKYKLQDFEKELLSEYGPGIIQVDDVDICKKLDNSKYIRVSCTYEKEDKEDDKSTNSNDD